MKKLIFTLAIMGLCLSGLAQNSGKVCRRYTAITDSATNKLVYQIVQTPPSLYDSTITIEEIIRNRILDNGIEPGCNEIEISFIVQPDGSITRGKVISKLKQETKEEIEKLMEQLPQMRPGRIRDAKVPVIIYKTIQLKP